MELPENHTFEDVKDFTDDIILFINKHYRDIKETSSLIYTRDHFRWYFNNSNYNFILLKHFNKIIGCISGKVDTIYINKHIKTVFEINFLCLHLLYRSKGYINFLKDEIKKKALQKNIYTVVYIAHNKHNKSPISKVNYYMHYINPIHLYNIGYLDIPFYIPNKINYIKNKYKKVIEYDIKCIKLVKNEPVNFFIIDNLNRKYYFETNLSKCFNSYQLFNNFPNIITTFTLYVNSKIRGFISYYHLNYKNNITGITVNQAYILYYWQDKELLPEDLIFKNTFNKLNVDIIITTDIFEMASEELRKKIMINEQGNYIFYYLYNKDDSNKEFNLKASEIGLFIP